ncbi:YihY/virulence factor BrkB family protein [Litorilinea aerophila]|uniref:YihY/virulence factor BrkB family protein n=1 Tax=Litorilinea aerophila TaxID=1204385 RepID=A0A540VJJ3_9CHLR|nr:YihY/virulence factor BrkB family protein [Litorilinea aerophila]MCC9075413.1 YihY/virulence factor BrkB family protein [Litorilinea aerophila]
MPRRPILASAAAAFREALDGWRRHHGGILAAALAYQTVLSLAPLVLVALALGSLLLGTAGAEGQLVSRLGPLLGPEGASLVQGILRQMHARGGAPLATGTGLLLLLLGASAVFRQLQTAMDIIWEVPQAQQESFRQGLRQRLISFLSSLLMVLGMGLILPITLGLEGLVAVAVRYLPGWVPLLTWIQAILQFAVLPITMMALFALIYRFLPRIRLSWRQVWGGAVVTALLFTVGEYGVHLYLARNTLASYYGAAGSLVVFLLWVNYTASIFLWGAELVRAYVWLERLDDSSSGRIPGGGGVPSNAPGDSKRPPGSGK